jgi:hypothetical protein
MFTLYVIMLNSAHIDKYIFARKLFCMFNTPN